MKSNKVNKIKPIKNWFMVTILFYFSSIVIKGIRTKVVNYCMCVLKEKYGLILNF